MIDIHSYIKYEDGKYQVQEVLEDMKKNNIEKRVVSSINNLDNIENLKYLIKIVRENKGLLGCAYINPKDKTAIETVKLASKSDEIKMFEFNSFNDGYYPELMNNLEEIFNIIALSKKPVKVFVGIGARSIPQQWEIYAKKFPNIKFIFLHMGCFDYGYTCIDVIKRNKNIFTEISNQYELQILRKALKELEIDKLLFGTTFPYRLTESALHIFELFNLSEKILNKIYNENVKKILFEG